MTSDSLRIGITHWVGSQFIQHVIPEYHRLFPSTKLYINQKGAHDLEEMLKKRQLDFCVLHAPFYDIDLSYETLQKERILLVGNRDYELVRHHPTDISNPAFFDVRLLKNENIILNEPEQVLHRMAKSTFAKYSINPPVILETTSTLSLTSLVAAGLGYTFIPEYGRIFSEDLEHLAFYTIDRPALSWSISAVYRNSEALSESARSFIDLVKEFYRRSSVLSSGIRLSGKRRSRKKLS